MEVSFPPLWLPNTIPHNKVITVLSHSAGAVGGTGTVRSFKTSVLLIQYDDKRNSPEPGFPFLLKHKSGN
jgi:hypothetical protein